MISDIYLTVGSKQKINIDNIKLESYSKNIIEVDNSNVIKAINIGETIVKATAEDEKISYFKVIVTNKDIEMIDILLNKSKITLNIGDTEQLKATLKPINATNIQLNWTSSDTKVATVDQNGKITAKENGMTLITVQSNNGKKSTCEVIVNTKNEIINIDITNININKNNITMYVGDTEQLFATIEPNNATNKDISWLSDNTNIATIDQTGKVTALNQGYVTITAVSTNGVTAKCQIKIEPKTNPIIDTNIEVTNIILNETSKTIYLNSNSKTVNLTATVEPSNATNKNIIWTSSNNNIAKVENGKVTALNTGTATITAKIEGDKHEASFKLTVKKKIIIVIGASQVTRMNNYKTSYNSTNYNYSVKNKTLNYIYSGGSGFSYQTGSGWNKAKSIIETYKSQKDSIEFFVFFPLSGNDIKKFKCSDISSNNSTMKGYAANYNNIISNIKKSGYNVTAFVVSMHPLKVSQSSSSYVVTNESSNSCKKNYRSNKKYNEFNKAMRTIINNSYTNNLNFEYLFEYIMKINDKGKNFSYKVTYNTTDGIHWNSSTTNYYVNLMFNKTNLL